MDLNSVRAEAHVAGWTEVQCNMTSRVIGFLRGSDRVNVYWTTGTVGTCVDHPKSGKTQLFRRNQSMADLVAIFHNPRVHTGVGYYRKHGASMPEPSIQSPHRRVCVFAHEQDFICNAWDEDTVCLALGCNSVIGVQSNGSKWFSGIPKWLHNKLWGRQDTLPDIEVVALDASNAGYYYVQFTDGKSEWVGPESLSQTLQSEVGRVERICFAPDDGWYVQWDDGSSQWLNLPTGLHNQLQGSHKQRPGVEAISCGDCGEWFVRYLDGWWRIGAGTDGGSEALYEMIHGINANGEQLLSVEFGSDGGWAIVYA